MYHNLISGKVMAWMECRKVTFTYLAALVTLALTSDTYTLSQWAVNCTRLDSVQRARREVQTLFVDHHGRRITAVSEGRGLSIKQRPYSSRLYDVEHKLWMIIWCYDIHGMCKSGLNESQEKMSYFILNHGMRERERESIIITTWDSERAIQVCTSTLMQSLRA